MTTRYQKAKAWRTKRELTCKQLAELTGYTEITIYWFERGVTPPQRNGKSGNAADRGHKDWVFQRYKRACGDVDAELVGRKKGEHFDW
jgi:hypothetical protein